LYRLLKKELGALSQLLHYDPKCATTINTQQPLTMHSTSCNYRVQKRSVISFSSSTMATSLLLPFRMKQPITAPMIFQVQ